MKLAFSTLGVPGMPLEEVRALALRTGWTGIELLSSADEPVHTGLDESARRAARRLLTADVTLLSVNSYVRVGRADRSDEEVVDEILTECRLAADLGASAVRVFPGADHQPGATLIVRRLCAAADRLPTGVEIWLETHDSHSTGAEVAALLDAVADRRIRALWDIAHPCNKGEQWKDTFDALRPHLAHVQIKDERPPDHTPALLGDGVLPVAAILGHLTGQGYRQWVSLEWELKWRPTAAPLHEALTKGRAWLQEAVRADGSL